MDQRADPNKQYETRRDLIAQRRLMFELGEGEKLKQKQQAGAGFDRGSGEGCRLELGSTGGAERGAGWSWV